MKTDTTGTCGACAHLWVFDGDSILPYWNGRAGTCTYRGMGHPFRTLTDNPLFSDCWKESECGDQPDAE